MQMGMPGKHGIRGRAAGWERTWHVGIMQEQAVASINRWWIEAYRLMGCVVIIRERMEEPRSWTG